MKQPQQNTKKLHLRENVCKHRANKTDAERSTTAPNDENNSVHIIYYICGSADDALTLSRIVQPFANERKKSRRWTNETSRERERIREHKERGVAVIQHKMDSHWQMYLLMFINFLSLFFSFIALIIYIILLLLGMQFGILRGQYIYSRCRHYHYTGSHFILLWWPLSMHHACRMWTSHLLCNNFHSYHSRYTFCAWN